MVNQMEKINRLLICSKCRHPFHENELKRVFPGKTKTGENGKKMSMTITEATGKKKLCYCCAVPHGQRNLHRCRRCCNLIQNDKLECDNNKCYYRIMYKSPLLREEEEEEDEVDE